MPDSKDESSFRPLYFTVSFRQKGQATLENRINSKIKKNQKSRHQINPQAVGWDSGDILSPNPVLNRTLKPDDSQLLNPVKRTGDISELLGCQMFSKI